MRKRSGEGMTVTGRRVEMQVGRLHFAHAGIRMLLHERAPEGLNPSLKIADLGTDFAGFNSWLGDHLLNVGLRSQIPAETRALFLSIIRRATHALTHFTSAREHTLRYASWDCSGAIPASAYFGAIENWENCLLQFQILMDIMNKSAVGKAGWRAYERGDRSTTERMCEMANRVKHSTRAQVTAKELTPLWLEKDGIGALDGYSVTYTELVNELSDVCQMALRLVDPSSMAATTMPDGQDTTAED